MRNKILTVPIVFLLIFSLCACQTQSGGAQQNAGGETQTEEGAESGNGTGPAGTEAPPAQSGPALPALDSPYDVEVFYQDESRSIISILQTELPLQMIYSVPYVDPELPGAARINAQLWDTLQAFWGDADEQVSLCLDYAKEYSEQQESSEYYYYFNHDGSAAQQGDYVSVTVGYDWWMGGVNDYGSQSRVFRAADGEAVGLREFFPGESDEAILAQISAVIEAQPESGDFLFKEQVLDYAVDDFDFYLKDGGLWLQFDKYELSYGAAGAFDLLLKESI